MPRKRKVKSENTEADDDTPSTRKRSSARLASKNKSCYFEADASEAEQPSTTTAKRAKKSTVRKNKQSSNSKEAKNTDNITSMIEGSESEYFTKVCDRTLEANSSGNNDTGYDDSNSSDDEWEEVADADNVSGDELANYKPQLPAGGVEITVNVPTNVKKQKKKLSVDDLVRQQINKRLKENQENLHKTHLLCCIAHGLFVNTTVLMSDTVKAISLSYLSESVFNIKKEMNVKILKKLLEWFTERFELVNDNPSKHEVLSSDTICDAFQLRRTSSEALFVLMLISLLRTIESVSVEVRLCYAINPLPIKPKNLILTDKQREQRQSKKKDNKNKEAVEITNLVSSDDDDVIAVSTRKPSEKIKRNGNFWLEVYLPSSKKWVCVDPVTNSIDDVSKISENIHELLLYVFAFDNENHIKDVTQRYYLNWTESKFRKNRVDETWLQESLNAFRTPFTERDNEENSQLSQIASSQPLPATLAAFKNHPLYVLERHLLKYEVIYPKNAPKVGTFRGDNIYSREYVHTVHSDIYWRRQGRVITSGEEAYKVAKARPKWDKVAQKFIRDLPLELFGYWQTEPFIPPVAKDGKVPRNEFGNVELFQPGMLPIGTVHIPLPGLLRIANKLGIDCVPAVVGFDCHSGGGGTHPVYDGFVVCEEFKEVLLAAYDEEEENTRKRLQEKKINRILGNWRRLIKAALIREKLRNKYSSDT